MCPCRRMRRCTSYLPCLSRSLCWNPTSCCLLRTRTTSRKDWRRSSRSSRTLCSPYWTWSPTTTSTPSRSKSKIWLAGQDQLRDSQVRRLKKWSIIFTLPSSCKYYSMFIVNISRREPDLTIMVLYRHDLDVDKALSQNQLPCTGLLLVNCKIRYSQIKIGLQ